MESLSDRLALLESDLSGRGSLLVAFSGGVDSTYLLAVAQQVLGAERVLAVTGVSASLSAVERAHAGEVASALGARHRELVTHEGDLEGYRANTGNRCYFCKSTLLGQLVRLAEDERLAAVATGTNATDADDPFRPGMRAAAELGVVAPLRDAGLSKDDIRTASAALGLSTWDKPASPCLASRIAYGIEVTPRRLARVEHAEAAVRDLASSSGLALHDLRVRDLGSGVRVEVDAALVDELDRDELTEAVAASGFTAPVSIAAYSYGSLNVALA